ncbi:MAG: T9SS type A sorting domain-containing protein [Flavobacteriales bacterium]|nr:T9SS type A sorting domain-containing protein [Flavobacteriales bacterium]
MRKSICSLLLLTCLFSSTIFSQSTGDTIIVNVLNYQSSSRDVVANFPTNSNLSFERVIMRYAMRCKNGLVSPPVSGQTNLGCGEWDYSCNTYITDSTKADSSTRIIDKYVIYPDTNTNGIYSNTPTWSGVPLIQQTVNLQSIITEDTATVGLGNVIDSSLVKSINNGGKTYLLLTSIELTSAGLVSGNIDGFSFTNLGQQTQLLNLKVKIKSTTLNQLSFPDSSDFRATQEVYYHNYTAISGLNRVQFHTPFNWNGSSNLLIELSYKAPATNNHLPIKCHTTASVQAISSSNDLSLNLTTGNYVRADSYQGVGGTNQRTVEARIKTSVADKDIVSWGANRAGEKFIVRLDNNGRLRVEVNGGSYVSTTILNDDKWHHIAITFSGVSTYHFKFYVDGVKDNPTAITSNAVNTAMSSRVQISGGFHNRFWEGNIDNLRIWSTALPDSVIAKWRYKKMESSHPSYANLELEYTFDSSSSTIIDNSSNGRSAAFGLHNSYNSLIGEEHFKSYKSYSIKPNINLYQGNYNLTISNDTILDTTYFTPYSVIENTIFPKYGTVFSDSIGTVNTSYWPQNNTLYDLSANLISSNPSSNTTQITNSSLSYFQRNAAKLELMSFVTPYGINLDLGINGKAWYFDVSDFTPILKGPRRITLERGGQWQEEMDIQFLFIVGTPPRDVKRIDQIWPVSSRSYSQITNNAYFAPITLDLDTSASQFKVRSVITGHGQQGEFIARNHFININGGPIEFNRSVWKECAENPVFPQGGTWIYDRAGWCPGMPSDIQEYDITTLVGSADTVEIDYGVSTASGDSRYIVNNQLVSYGSPNFNLDGRITEVISPTNHTEHGKRNPVCSNAEIIFQNSGSTQITTAVFEYWINNGTKDLFTWSGSLDFLEKATINLPTSAPFWTQLSSGSNTFYARLVSTNGLGDQYIHNDTIIRNFIASEVVQSNFIIEFMTNSAGFQSRYEVRDDAGALVFQNSGLASNTTYRDTFNLSLGCYSLNVFDSNDDGLSFFGNSNGNGAVRLKTPSGTILKVFEPNFGDGFQYNFTISTIVGIEELDLGRSISISPNPVSNQLSIETTGLNHASWVVYDELGRKLQSGVTPNDLHHSITLLNVSNFENGLYFIHFTKKESSNIQKFIVSH